MIYYFSKLVTCWEFGKYGDEAPNYKLGDDRDKAIYYLSTYCQIYAKGCEQMKPIGSTGRAWLKGFHIFFACTWIGTAISMQLLTFVRSHISTGDELWAVNAAIKLLDDYIIIPSAFGVLITGILFSWLTNWGFFKFNWIIVKYLINIEAILFGTFFLGPWVNGMEAISKVERLSALQNITYLHNAKMVVYFGPLQALILIAAVFITVLKPWGKRGKAEKKPHN